MLDAANILAKILAAARKLPDTPAVRRFVAAVERETAVAQGPPRVLVAVEAGAADAVSIAAQLDGAKAWKADISAIPEGPGDETTRERALAALETAAWLILVGDGRQPPSPLTLELAVAAHGQAVPVVVFLVGQKDEAPPFSRLLARALGEDAPTQVAEDVRALADTAWTYITDRLSELAPRHGQRMARLAAKRREELAALVAASRRDADAQAEEERFWLRQEARRTGRIGQPGCSLSGMLTLALKTPGDFAVVVHADRDCVTAVKLNPYAPPVLGRLYCTNLDEADIVTGRSAERLAQCLAALARERRPRFILLLTSCPVIVAHDPFREVAGRAEAETGVPVAAVATHGLGHFAQAQIVDLFARTLVETAERAGMAANGKASGVRLLGFPEVLFDDGRGGAGEAARLLGETGVENVRSVGVGSAAEEWAELPAAKAVVVPDRALFAGLLARLEARGARILEAAPPIGIEASLSFYLAIASLLGNEQGQALAQAARALEAEARKAVEFRRADLDNLKVGYGLGMFVDFNPATLASDGLAEARALADYGVAVEYLIQGVTAPEKLAEARRRIAAAVGDAPCHGVRDIATLDDLVAKRGLSLILAAEHMGVAAGRSAAPLLRLGSLAPGLAATADNLDRLLSAAGEERSRP